MGSMFILFDGRAKCGCEDDASVMDTADTETEARESGLTDWRNYDAIWFECPEIGPNKLGPGVPRWDLPPASVELPQPKRRRRRRKRNNKPPEPTP